MNIFPPFFLMAQRLSRIAVLIVSTALLVLASPVYADPLLEKDLVLSREYRSHIQLKTLEIYELNENLDWLDRKIKRLNYLGQPVPSQMFQSIAYKKKRIAALEKERKNYTMDLEKITARIPQDNPVSLARTNLMDQIKKSEISEWFEFLPDREGIQIRTTLPILFTSGSAVVAREYDAFLKKVSSFVKDYKVWILVDGFADPDPIKTKQFPSNFELGATRAANIVHSLVDYGVDPDVFKVSSTGKYRFPDARHMSKKKALERYINITIMFDAF